MPLASRHRAATHALSADRRSDLLRDRPQRLRGDDRTAWRPQLQTVFHLHFHILPRWTGVELRPPGGPIVAAEALRPVQRGRIWKCRWKTVWPDALSLYCSILTPSAFSPCFAAMATFCTAGMKRARSPGPMSRMLRAAIFGTTTT